MVVCLTGGGQVPITRASQPSGLIMRPILPCLLLCLTVLGALPARAQTHPTDAQLELLYKAHDWHGLGTALTTDLDLAFAQHGRDWLGAKVEQGAPFPVVQLYAAALWWTGNADPHDPPQDDRIRSATMTLYAFELLAIDGAICADRSAPSQHAGKLFHQREKTMAYLRAQLPVQRQLAIDAALALEHKTAPLRQEDLTLCRGGRAEMEAGMKLGGTPHDVEGSMGAAMAIEAPPGWVPPLLPPAQAAASVAQNRANMGATLRNLVDHDHP